MKPNLIKIGDKILSPSSSGWKPSIVLKILHNEKNPTWIAFETSIGFHGWIDQSLNNYEIALVEE